MGALEGHAMRNRNRQRWVRGRAALGGLVLSATLAGCATRPTPPPATESPSPPHPATAFSEAMREPLGAWRASPADSVLGFMIPGTAIAAAVDDAAPLAAASGQGASGVPLEPGDAFHIGSMTKLFTAALIMQLDEERLLSLEDTIDTWFPAAPNGGEITVLMLLQHESGLYELDFDLVGHVTPQELIDASLLQAPIAAPGTEYQYLNLGYILLGRIAELSAQAPYEELVRTRLVEPLGLTSTYVYAGGTGAGAVPGFELVCDAGEGLDCVRQATEVRPQAPSPQWPGAWSAGGMVSTAADQAVWLRALVAGDVVDAEHRALMRDLTPLSAAYYAAAYGKSGVTEVQLGEGAGLATWAVPGVGECHGHAGAIPGSNGIGAYCPDADLSIVVLNAINPAGTSPGYPGLLELAPAALAALSPGSGR